MSDADIATLLQQSRAAHQQYQQAVRLRNPAAVKDALFEAQRTRIAAQSLDPEFTAPAWAGDASMHSNQTFSHREIHDELVRFYQEQLSR